MSPSCPLSASKFANPAKDYKTTYIKTVTKEVYDKINKRFESEYGISFDQALHFKTPGINVQLKENRMVKKAEARKTARKYRQKIQDEWQISQM